MILSIISCTILLVHSHQLVAPGFKDSWGEDAYEFNVMQLHALFSRSHGIIHTLPDAALSASHIHSDFLAKFARINTEGFAAWCGVKGAHNTLTVDMMTSYLVTGVVTKGRSGYSQYVSRYSLETSENGLKWVSHGEFVGNFNNINTCTVRFKTPVFARFVKFTVLKYNSYPMLKLDVLVYDIESKA